jgi:hypothetical protein
MANPHKGEVPFTFEDEEGNRQHFVFRFSNEGKRLTESAAGMTKGEIMQALNSGDADGIKSALFWGATRKNHRREFPVWPQSVDNFFDDVFDPVADEHEPGDGEIPLHLDLLMSLISAYQKRDKAEMLKAFFGDDDEEASEPEAPKAKRKKPTPVTDSPEERAS